MAPVHFPTGSAYRLRGRVRGHTPAHQGGPVSRESPSPTTQNDRESSGMKNRGNKNVE